MSNIMSPTFLGAALLITALAAVIDLRTGHIPDRLTLGTLAGALAAHCVAGALSLGIHGAGSAALFSVLGAVACSLVPPALCRFAKLGGGDLKLLVAIGAL